MTSYLMSFLTVQNVLQYFFCANIHVTPYSIFAQKFVVKNLVNNSVFKKNKQNLPRIDDPTVALATIVTVEK